MWQRTIACLSRIHAPAYQGCFFLLFACHEGRGRSPSVSEMGEKTDFLTFQLNCKNIQIEQRCNKQTTPRSSWLKDREPAGTVDGVVPVHSTIVMGVRDTTDGECNGTGTQRNRRSDGDNKSRTMNDKVSPVKQLGTMQILI